MHARWVDVCRRRSWVQRWDSKGSLISELSGRFSQEVLIAIAILITNDSSSTRVPRSPTSWKGRSSFRRCKDNEVGTAREFRNICRCLIPGITRETGVNVTTFAGFSASEGRRELELVRIWPNFLFFRGSQFLDYERPPSKPIKWMPNSLLTWRPSLNATQA